MQRLRNRIVSFHLWGRTISDRVGMALVIALHALIIYGFASGIGTVTDAQPSKPAISEPGFSPPRPIRYLHRFPPYPSDSMELGEEGTVWLKLNIAANGQVTNAVVVKSSGSIRLDKTTVKWVKSHWRYYPATLNGQAVASSIAIKVTFAMSN